MKRSCAVVLCCIAMLWAGVPGHAQESGPPPLPQGFLWGSVLSAHSVEGNAVNDWTAWEAVPGHIADGSTSGAACNHLELYAEDHAWMKKLGQNAAIVSLDWSRLHKGVGSFDDAAVKHYRAMLTSMRGHGIEPYVVLWDRTLPPWIAAYGGLECPGIILHFAEYAGFAGKAFGDLVDFWIPLREPVQHAVKAFKDRAYPPGKADVGAYGKAVVSLMGMHRGAWQALKQQDRAAARQGSPAAIGLLVSRKLVTPARPDSTADRGLVATRENLSSKTFVESIMQGDLFGAPPPATNPKDAKNKLGAGIQISNAGVLDAKGQMPPAQAPKPDYSQRKADFLVISYEGLELVKFNVLMPLFTEKVIPAGCWQDNLGRVIYPAGLPLLLKECSRYPIPLFVQLSIADAEGKQRGAYLTEHVKAIQMALGDGCQVSGLFYDSLLDGFGYNYGYSLKTGLLKVNTTIQERKPAGGAAVFRGLALSNGSNPVPLNMKRPRRGKPPAR